MRRVREHRALGHRTILITGALSFAVEGLRPLFDEIVAAEMSIRPDGTYSGEMITVPPTGEARAQILSDYCDAEGFNLDECGRLRRLVVGPAAVRGGRVPRRREPRDAARHDRPQAWLARRELEQVARRTPAAAAVRAAAVGTSTS